MSEHVKTFNIGLQKFQQYADNLLIDVRAGKTTNELEKDLHQCISFAEQLDEYAATNLVDLKPEEFNNTLLAIEHVLFEVELELLERDGLAANQLINMIGSMINLMTGLPTKSSLAFAAKSRLLIEV